LFLATGLIFLGSFYVEILLDIRDTPGDKENGIFTIPVLFGKSAAFSIAKFILHFNILFQTMNIVQLETFRRGVYFFLICFPLLHDFNSLERIENSSEKEIEFLIHKTTAPMVIALLYFCLLAV
jgi:4-hydroxybenzoate polyprenyltransferase